MLENILRELEKRASLADCIDTIITKYYMHEPKKRLYRGQVQREIIDKMGLVRNNLLCTMINERMAALGYSVGTTHGTKYYRNISPRPI